MALLMELLATAPTRQGCQPRQGRHAQRCRPRRGRHLPAWHPVFSEFGLFV